jgi:DNA repair exonuclease SbcCD ATPase subunit
MAWDSENLVLPVKYRYLPKNIRAMKINREQLIYLAIIFLMIVTGFLMFGRNQRNVKKVEMKIDTLAAELHQMNLLTESVAENLRQTISLITNVSAELETTSRELENMLREAGSITSQQKEKIKNALREIEETKKSVEEEKQKALKLIGDLNSTENANP